MVSVMATIHMSEAEAAEDFKGLINHVRAGTEVVRSSWLRQRTYFAVAVFTSEQSRSSYGVSMPSAYCTLTFFGTSISPTN